MPAFETEYSGSEILMFIGSVHISEYMCESVAQASVRSIAPLDFLQREPLLFECLDFFAAGFHVGGVELVAGFGDFGDFEQREFDLLVPHRDGSGGVWRVHSFYEDHFIACDGTLLLQLKAGEVVSFDCFA